MWQSGRYFTFMQWLRLFNISLFPRSYFWDTDKNYYIYTPDAFWNLEINSEN